MNYGQISSLPYACDFAGKRSANNMKNGSLSFGVVNPPDKLPTQSLYEAVHSHEYLDPNQPFFDGKKSDKSLKAGKVGVGCTIAAMALSALSLLPFIRKH